MAADGRVTDYDRIADRFDQRYSLYAYDGVRETLLNFLGPAPVATLEVGCGTGHWLTCSAKALAERSGDRSAKALAERQVLAGVDPSAAMLDRARSLGSLTIKQELIVMQLLAAINDPTEKSSESKSSCHADETVSDFKNLPESPPEERFQND